jgi:hypothetical protein
MERINPYKPEVIILQYSDWCRICREKMKPFSEGMWRGPRYGMMHVDCYKKFIIGFYSR